MTPAELSRGKGQPGGATRVDSFDRTKLRLITCTEMADGCDRFTGDGEKTIDLCHR
jgi:hypothetical protein